MKRFRVQLVAFGQADEMFAPLVGDDVAKPEITYHARHMYGWWRSVRSLAPRIRGEAIICIKPLLASFGAGLLLGRRLKRPVIVDVDDWERGFLFPGAIDWEMRFFKLGWLTRADSPLYTRLLEGRVPDTPAVLVSNTLLQGMFGGHWIPHCRDLAQFSPRPRRRIGGPKVVMFVGQPRPHKGLSTLIDAWRMLDRRDAVLRIVVPNPAAERAGLEIGGMTNVEVIGPVPFAELPAALAEAHVVVVPQDNTRASIGQLPVKMLDAMAMGRAIVATDVCDASRWLADGAGRIVPPGSVPAMAAAISDLLDDPEGAETMGARARSRLEQLASEDLLASRLGDIVDGVIRQRPLPPEPAFSDLHQRARFVQHS